MSNVDISNDPTVDLYADTYATQAATESDSELEDALFSQLDEFDDTAYREQRLEMLKKE